MTDYRAIWDYEAQPKESARCNLCDARSYGVYVIHATEDRYGFQQSSYRCEACGLVFLSPRMTREAYARFYETAYRPLVSAFHGREINAQTIQGEQAVYAKELAGILAPWTEWTSRLLDVGGSTGVVAAVLRRDLGIMWATVLDPAPAETDEAKRLVEDVITGTIEDFDAGERRFDLITLCQTADHLLDLMGSLKKIKGLLSPDGLFWSDIVNFDITREVKIDHPFNLTESTYRKFLSKAGFSLLQVNYAPDGKHIGFLCK